MRSLQFGSVATNVLMPWLLLLLIVMGLLGFRYFQVREFAVLKEHSALHRQATLLATELRFLSQERWSNMLAYQATRAPEIVTRVEHSEGETGRKIEDLKHLFPNAESHRIHGGGDQDQALLDSYRQMRDGLPELYGLFVKAIDAGDLAHQARLVTLLTYKIQLVRAALDDLTAYHRKTEEVVEANRQSIERQSELVFFGLLAVLILAGIGFSRYQTLAIVRPLNDLTLAARKVGAGETADLTRFAGKGEIGELSRALSQMVDALQRSHQDLAANRDRLALAYADVEAKVEQRTAELQSRTDELSTANKDLEGFSYSVSHDLRAPLRAIDGFIAILMEDYGSTLDAEGLRLFGIVQQNANKMGDLIDDILAFSRAGRLELEHLCVDMNALVDEVWAELARQRGDRPIEFHRAELPAVECDIRALRQIWVNLLGNAIKFSRGRDPARIEVASRQQDGMTWFEVKDNGVGFNQEYKDKLFSLFLRLHGMDEFEGTGVGLAIVKRFVQKHGGCVAAEGAVGAGATFGFGLPSGPAQQTS